MRGVRGRLRLSIRTRLALAHAAVLFVMGLAVIAVSYWMVDRALSPSGTHGVVIEYAQLPRSVQQLDGLLTPARSDRGLEATEPVDLDGVAARALDQVCRSPRAARARATSSRRSGRASTT